MDRLRNSQLSVDSITRILEFFDFFDPWVQKTGIISSSWRSAFLLWCSRKQVLYFGANEKSSCLIRAIAHCTNVRKIVLSEHSAQLLPSFELISQAFSSDEGGGGGGGGATPPRPRIETLVLHVPTITVFFARTLCHVVNISPIGISNLMVVLSANSEALLAQVPQIQAVKSTLSLFCKNRPTKKLVFLSTDKIPRELASALPFARFIEPPTAIRSPPPSPSSSSGGGGGGGEIRKSEEEEEKSVREYLQSFVDACAVSAIPKEMMAEILKHQSCVSLLLSTNHSSPLLTTRLLAELLDSFVPLPPDNLAADWSAGECDSQGVSNSSTPPTAAAFRAVLARRANVFRLDSNRHLATSFVHALCHRLSSLQEIKKQKQRAVQPSPVFDLRLPSPPIANFFLPPTPSARQLLHMVREMLKLGASPRATMKRHEQGWSSVFPSPFGQPLVHAFVDYCMEHRGPEEDEDSLFAILQGLKDCGADFSQRDSKGNTALHHLIFSTFEKIRAGALSQLPTYVCDLTHYMSRCSLNALNNNGQSAFVLITRELLGADVERRHVFLQCAKILLRGAIAPVPPPTPSPTSSGSGSAQIPPCHCCMCTHIDFHRVDCIGNDALTSFVEESNRYAYPWTTSPGSSRNLGGAFYRPPVLLANNPGELIGLANSMQGWMEACDQVYLKTVSNRTKVHERKWKEEQRKNEKTSPVLGLVRSKNSAFEAVVKKPKKDSGFSNGFIPPPALLPIPSPPPSPPPTHSPSDSNSNGGGERSPSTRLGPLQRTSKHGGRGGGGGSASAQPKANGDPFGSLKNGKGRNNDVHNNNKNGSRKLPTPPELLTPIHPSWVEILAPSKPSPPTAPTASNGKSTTTTTNRKLVVEKTVVKNKSPPQSSVSVESPPTSSSSNGSGTTTLGSATATALLTPPSTPPQTTTTALKNELLCFCAKSETDGIRFDNEIFPPLPHFYVQEPGMLPQEALEFLWMCVSPLDLLNPSTASLLPSTTGSAKPAESRSEVPGLSRSGSGSGKLRRSSGEEDGLGSSGTPICKDALMLAKHPIVALFLLVAGAQVDSDLSKYALPNFVLRAVCDLRPVSEIWDVGTCPPESSVQSVKTQTCFYASQNRCKKGRECFYAHSPDEIGQPIRPTAAIKSSIRNCTTSTKQSLCNAWVGSGRCGKGTECKYAHGNEGFGEIYVEPHRVTSAAPQDRGAEEDEEDDVDSWKLFIPRNRADDFWGPEHKSSGLFE